MLAYHIIEERLERIQRIPWLLRGHDGGRVAIHEAGAGARREVQNRDVGKSKGRKKKGTDDSC